MRYLVMSMFLVGCGHSPASIEYRVMNENVLHKQDGSISKDEVVVQNGRVQVKGNKARIPYAGTVHTVKVRGVSDRWARRVTESALDGDAWLQVRTPR